MRRTTIVLPEDLRARVRRLAAERGVSMATIMRDAIEQKMNEKRPKPRSLGIAASSHSDTSVISADIRPKPRS